MTTIRKYDPTYTVEQLIDFHHYNEDYECFNTCVVKDVVYPYPHCQEVITYDNISVVNISIMNNEIPANINKLKNVLDQINQYLIN